MEERHRLGRRRVGAAVAAAVVGVVGAWLGMSLLARTTVPMGPFHVELDAGFGRGETRLGLPPFGALTADTHLSPLRLSATLQDVGVQRLTDAVNRRGIDGLVADVERDARDRIAPLAARVLLIGALGAAVLALLVFRTRWRLVAASVSFGVLSVALCELLVLSTFRPGAFTEPTYSGSLALAPKLIGPAREATCGRASSRSSTARCARTPRCSRDRSATTRSACSTSRTCTRLRWGSTSPARSRSASTSTW
jgi:hypothetical protein